MDVLNSNIKDSLDKEQLEYLQKKKHEYKLLGRYTRRTGHNLYCLKHQTGKIEEIKIRRTSTAKIIPNGTGGLTWIDADYDSVMVDSRDTFFEALNMRNAERRVERFKRGDVKELSNLQFRNGKIKIF